MCLHTPAHKINSKLNRRPEPVEIPYTPEEDVAFEALGPNSYERADTSWTERLADSPYNHRDCDVLCAFGPSGVDSQWQSFVQAVGYELAAVTWLPAGSTRRSMFADDKDAARIVDDRICDREWDWYA